MTLETPPRLALLDVVKTFKSPTGEAAAVRGVSLSIKEGEVFGVIGESGAGKSTLIRLMNLLERPTAGRVLLDGEDLASLSPDALCQRRRRIGMIFQHFNLLNSKTVAENVVLPLRLEGGLSARERHARAAALIERVGLSGLGDKYPGQLSGGQKQRVAIARALACNPKVLLCDEATSALDPETTEQILSLLAELNRDLGLTLVVITHEMDVVRQICDRVAVMEAGQVAEIGAVIDVFLNAASPATRRLLREDDAAPQVGGADRIFRLTYRGAIAAEPFLSRVAQTTGLDFSLHRARAGDIKGEPYGQLILSLGGPRLDEALASFTAAGVQVQELGR